MNNNIIDGSQINYSFPNISGNICSLPMLINQKNINNKDIRIFMQRIYILKNVLDSV